MYEMFVTLTLAALLVAVSILYVGKKLSHVGGRIVQELDNLNNNLNKLNTDVDLLIASKGGGANATAIQAVADVVAALDQKVLAATPAPGQ